MKKIKAAIVFCLICQIYSFAQEYPDYVELDNQPLSGSVISLEQLYDLECDEECQHRILMKHRNYCILRFGVGYINQITGKPLSSSIGQLSDYNLSIDFLYRKMYAGLNVSTLSGVLKTDDFYYDTKENYQWKSNENVLLSCPTIRAGYSLIERGRFRITPFMGVGPSSLEQRTGIKNNKNQEIESEIKGYRVETGLFVDFRVWDFYFTLNGIELSAGIYATRDKLGPFEPTYSLNTCISLHLAFEPD